MTCSAIISRNGCPSLDLIKGMEATFGPLGGWVVGLFRRCNRRAVGLLGRWPALVGNAKQQQKRSKARHSTKQQCIATKSESKRIKVKKANNEAKRCKTKSKANRNKAKQSRTNKRQHTKQINKKKDTRRPANENTNPPKHKQTATHKRKRQPLSGCPIFNFPGSRGYGFGAESTRKA